MNHTEKLELLANALISEVVPLVSEFQSEEAFNAVFKAKVKDCTGLFVSAIKDRFTDSLAGKKGFDIIKVTVKHMRFFNQLKKELPELIEDAANLALDVAERKSISELQAMGLNRMTLDGAITAIVQDEMLEAGL